MKPSLLSTGLALALLFTGAALASPQISAPAGGSLRVESARLTPAAGGSYVSGKVESSSGYAAPSTPHVHVSAYDSRGRLLAEKDDKLNRDSLVRSHLQPAPHASYVVFLAENPANIARITVLVHGGHAAPQ